MIANTNIKSTAWLAPDVQDASPRTGTCACLLDAHAAAVFPVCTRPHTPAATPTYAAQAAAHAIGLFDGDCQAT